MISPPMSPRVLTSPRSGRVSGRLGLLAILACLAMLASALGPRTTPVRASATQESTFQDDNLLIYDTPAGVVRTLDTLRALGADRIRVSVFWAVVAPQPTSRTRPAFDATNPAAYPPGAWDRYDLVLSLAHARGIAVNFDITSPAPYWATRIPPRADLAKDYEPSSHEYDAFVRAVGTRYGGAYVPPGGSGRGDHPADPASPLPRVDYWAIWNEPNQAGWLTPQWVPATGVHGPGHYAERAPAIYRSLVDAAVDGLRATGHGSDTILIGETAPKGFDTPRGTRPIRPSPLTRSIKPLPFIHSLYCLDDRSRPLRGASARQQGCPTSAAASRGFPAAHPGLFAISGFSHHPYELTFAPHRRPPDSNYVTIATLSRLTAALARVRAVYHRSVGSGGSTPLYLTEFGYQTNPPSPIGVTLSEQAAYLDESEFIAYENPQVRTLSQFLLEDDHPRAQAQGRLSGYGATFQSGLEFQGGRPKPSFSSYRLPVFLPHPSVSRGHALRVWGLVRAASRRSAAPPRVAIQLMTSSKGGAWRTIAMVSADHGHDYLDSRVGLPSSGRLRLAWADPTHAGQIVYSRTVRVKVR